MFFYLSFTKLAEFTSYLYSVIDLSFILSTTSSIHSKGTQNHSCGITGLPIFNRLIPSTLKSKGKIPVITYVARVFADQEKNCAAFDFNNMSIQAEKAINYSSPPCQKGFSKKTVWNSKTMIHEVKVTKKNMD